MYLVLFMMLKLATFASTFTWQRRNGTNVYYSKVSIGVTMREAQNICLANNGSLTSITSRDESDYIFSQYRAKNDHAWIGLTDEQQEGRWQWLDGAPYAFTFWANSEPSGGSRENCALLRYNDWVDTSCSDRWSFICKMVFPIDECADETLNDCHQACSDTYESYTCSCFEGYLSQVVVGQVTCKDIDECSNKTLNNCQQNCSNTDGGYRCTCFDGHKSYTVDGQVICEGWWMVDLRGLYSVEQIVLINRGDDRNSSLRTQTFQFDVFKTDPRLSGGFPNEPGDVCYARTEPLGEGEILTKNCTNPLMGRFVRFTRFGSDVINICEVKVMVSYTSHIDYYFTVSRNFSLPINPFLAIITTNALACTFQCQRRRDSDTCTAVNWVRTTKQCQMLKVDPRIGYTLTKDTTDFYVEA